MLPSLNLMNYNNHEVRRQNRAQAKQWQKVFWKLVGIALSPRCTAQFACALDILLGVEFER